MNAIFKNPAWLIGAVLLGLLIFAGRKSGGGDGRLQASIASQEIASRANVELSDISARRDVGMAQAMNQRAQIATSYQIDAAGELNTSKALSLSHEEVLRSTAVSERLGTLQVQTAREVAIGAQARDITLATMSAAALEQQYNLAASLMTNPSIMSHFERLAGFDMEKAKSLAVISSNTTRDIAAISADVQKARLSAPADNYRRQAETDMGTDAIGGIIEEVLPYVAAFFLA